MGWQENSVMDSRVRFISACLEDAETMSRLCLEFGISRKTGYKWLNRYRAYGVDGLEDLPRAPLHHGRATPLETVEAIVALKERHPHWGPKKLLGYLRHHVPSRPWPSASTIGEILRRHGLVQGRRRARWKAAGGGPWPDPEGPNAVWSADHKGWFRTRDGQRCEPLTVMDGASRYLLGLEACGSTADAEAWPVLERLFWTYGLPDRFRTDNGPPFASAGVAGLTPLAVRLIRLGIRLERIQPGKPQQNGRHERFHLTLRPLVQAPCPDRIAQQSAFEAFRQIYNDQRPHEALGQTPPADHYHPSTRTMPDTLPDPDYPPEAAVRRVRTTGEIKWAGRLVYIAQSLAGLPVALEETETGEWAVRFCHHPIGYIDRKTLRLTRRSNANLLPLYPV
ncbi:IS481 family transposase [Tepidimonas sp.]|uniref:IS481 family transposase n=1 Tax=Tepidimonas sp. TaxID=2002775 RepID=UPI002FE3499A